MVSSTQMKERFMALAIELVEESGEVDESMGDCWLDAIENMAIEIGDAVAVELIKQKAAHPPVQNDESVCPQCNQEGRYKGRRERELITRRGPTTITEPEYYCPCCRKAFFPADQTDRGIA